MQAMNVIGTSAMVKIGQRVPFRPAYVFSLTLQMIMILVLPMLAFWSPKKVEWLCMALNGFDDFPTPNVCCLK